MLLSKAFSNAMTLYSFIMGVPNLSSFKKVKEWWECPCLMVVVGWAFMYCVVQLGGLHWETNIRHMFPPQLNTMAAALTMLLFSFYIFTASALESASGMFMSIDIYVVTVVFS